MSDRCRAWGHLALPLISIVLSFLVGSLVIILSRWLVTGEVSRVSPRRLHGADRGVDRVRAAIVDTLVNTMPLLLGGLAVGSASRPVSSTSGCRASS